MANQKIKRMQLERELTLGEISYARPGKRPKKKFIIEMRWAESATVPAWWAWTRKWHQYGKYATERDRQTALDGALQKPYFMAREFRLPEKPDEVFKGILKK